MIEFENHSPQRHRDTEKVKNHKLHAAAELVCIKHGGMLVFSVSLCLCGEFLGFAR
jgi:hypothetical protein